MSTVGSVFSAALALYAMLGVAVGLAFVLGAATRILPQPATVTTPARILLFPGAAVLWPVVLRRWLQTARREPAG